METQETQMVRSKTVGASKASSDSFSTRLNTRWHKPAMYTFLAITLAHWTEHILQMYQIWGMGMAKPQAKGGLGMLFPWLVTSEWLHYGYAIVMLAGLMLLRPAMQGRARTWWTVALVIQVWHHFEHALLLIQALVHQNLPNIIMGSTTPNKVPLSVLQMFWPTFRPEIHLFYNAVVFVPMVVAMVLHKWPGRGAGETPVCSCASHSSPARHGVAA